MLNRLPLVALSLVPLFAACTDDSVVGTDEIDHATFRDYRIEAVDLPRTFAASRHTGLDLDGNGTIDNQLGMAYGTLYSQSPEFDIQAAIEPRLTTSLEWTVRVYDAVDGTVIGARLLTGGDASRAPAALDRDRLDAPLAGGVALVPLGALTDRFGDSAPGWIDADRFTLVIDSIDDRSIAAHVGFGVTRYAIDREMLPNLARYFTWELEMTSSEFARMCDTNADQIVSNDELAANPYWSSFLAPDLESGEVSLGIGVSGAR